MTGAGSQTPPPGDRHAPPQPKEKKADAPPWSRNVSRRPGGRSDKDVVTTSRPHLRIRRARMVGGIATGLGGHLLTVVAMFIAAAVDGIDVDRTNIGYGQPVLLIGQLILFPVCLAVGVTLAVKDEPGFGIGLLVGWAVGLLVVPISGFGFCIYMLSGAGE